MQSLHSPSVRIAGALTLAGALLSAGCDTSRPDTHGAGGQVEGAKVFRIYCAGCHGEDGARGDCTMVIANGKKTPEAELRSLIEAGRGKMPGWKKRLQPEEIEAVLRHVQQLEASASKR